MGLTSQSSRMKVFAGSSLRSQSGIDSQTHNIKRKCTPNLPKDKLILVHKNTQYHANELEWQTSRDSLVKTTHINGPLYTHAV